MSEPLLRVSDLYTAYGLCQVLFGVSLQVARGECVSLLGRNGVGKTTTYGLEEDATYLAEHIAARA